MDALRGILLVARTPRLWPLCAVPLAAAVLVYGLLGVLGAIFVAPHLRGYLSGGWAVWAQAAALVVWIVLFPFLFVLLAGIFSGLIFDRLSRAVETMHAGAAGLAPDVRLGCGRAGGDSLARLLLNGMLGAGALVLGLFLGPIPGVFAAALVGLLDFTSPAYLRRGVTLGPQARRLLGRLDGATIGFALVAGLVSLLPLVGVFFLPGLVAGGTLLTLRREATPPAP